MAKVTFSVRAYPLYWTELEFPDKIKLNFVISNFCFVYYIRIKNLKAFRFRQRMICSKTGQHNLPKN